MVDYTELVAPDYRNLVINPGGEPSIGSTWLASNGTAVSGSTTTTPASGDGTVEYTVTSTTSQSYYFAPLGPDEAQVHFLAFKIPQSRTVSFRVRLRAATALYARIHASWLVPDASAINGYTMGFSTGEAKEITSSTTMTEIVGNPSQAVTEVGTSVISAVGALNNTGWTTLEVFVDSTSVPVGATHWRPLIAVFSANPTTDPAPPGIGSVVWADEAIVLDSGANLSGITYFDGDTPNYIWEGTPYYSSSRTTPEEVPLPDDQAQPAVDTDNAPDPANTASNTIANDELDDGDADPLPKQVDPAVVEAARQLAVAEHSITTKTDPRHLCIVSDFQLGDSLFLNAVDDDDVTWICSDVEGWWTTPEPDVPDVPKAYFDGSFPTRGRYTSRVFTITGTFFPRYPDTVSRARDRLIRAANLAHKGDWFMAHEDPTENRTNTKGSQVWLAGQPLITTVNTQGRTDFSIPLRAPDSLKYGIKDGIPPGFNELTVTTANVQYPERAYPRTYPWRYPEAVYGTTDGTIDNLGNAWVYPVLSLKGPTAGALNIHNIATDQTMRIVKKLYPGETLQIDCATKQVTLNGVGNFRFYVDIDTDWIGIQPGSNRIRFSEEEITDLRAELTIYWRSGWIG